MALGSLSIVVFSDVRCPWAHVGVHRLLRAVHHRGLEGEITIDHRAFPLEVISDENHDGTQVDRTVRVLRDLEPGAGWTGWDPDAYPASSMLALEAVQAAKAVSPAASASLDRALRLAVFDQARAIDRLETVMEIAHETEGLDVDLFEKELRSGRPGTEVKEQTSCAGTEGVPASPTIVLPDGSSAVNPGLEFRLEDEVPVIESDDPDAYERLVETFLQQRTYD